MARAVFCCFAIVLGIELLRFASCEGRFDGPYTIVNRATGLRIFSSPQAGFALASRNEPIYRDQVWLLSDQGDGMHAIVNAANSLRMVAKSGADGDTDFFVIDGGPVYQDQKWFFNRQTDGSYVISNSKSGRRITVLSDGNGPSKIAALLSYGPLLPEQAWWLINQERDVSSRLVSELLAERAASVDLCQGAAAFRTETANLMLRLEEAQGTNGELLVELEKQRANASRWMHELTLAIETKTKLKAELEVKELAAARMVKDLHSRRNDTVELANKVRAKDMEITDVASELLREKAEVLRLANVIDALRAELVRVSADLQISKLSNAELLEEIQANDSWRHLATFSFQVHSYTQVLLVGIALVLVGALMSSCKRQRLNLIAEVSEQRALVARLQQDLEEDCVMQTGEVVGELGFDFGYQIINRVVNGETERLIKIQCPGVSYADVDINLIFNGCDVAMQRRATCGTEATSWQKRFRFRTSDGLFEFKEDQMQLERGFLQLVFRAYTFRSRLIRLPRQFSLAASDTDQCWDYPDYDDISSCYEGVSWLEPATSSSVADPVLAAPTSRSKSYADTESTASTAGGLGV